MATKRVVKSTIDFAEMAQRCPVSQKKNFQAFKAKTDSYIRKVMAYPEEVPKIDWSYYKANAANKAVIEQFEKQYNATKIPYPDDQGAISKIEAEEKDYVKFYSEFVKYSNERIKKYEQEIETIRNTKSYDKMTEEEFAFAHPEFSLDSLNKPTNFPHLPETQMDKDDVEFFRERGLVPAKPDKYIPY